jgi:hypothetical protein
MHKLEEIASKNELNQEQTLELIKVCYMYENLKINPGSFHETKYKTYDFFYLAAEIKKGKTPLEIMNNIIDECEKYSRAQIIKKHLNRMKN